MSTTRTTGGANWNVIALTDLGGRVVERYLYKPYGQMTVHQVTGYGDFNVSARRTTSRAGHL